MDSVDKTETSQPVEKFGTFLGVYIPSVLTILGLIMYLRFGWVIGNVGLGFTILIVVLASSITFITALSASAIATNMRVGVGGEYYMISRSLGLELGGAIGIPLFLCRTLSITFYSFGLAEAIAMFLPQSPPSYVIQLIAAVIIIAITIVSGKSASLVLKLQIPIMIAVGLSILALLIGVFSNELRAPEMIATYRTAPRGFWYVFAVFFPAVTGFTAGIGMSGDLKNPSKSIPKGTILAVSTGTLIYLLIPVFLSITTKVSFHELASLGVGTWSAIAVLGAWLIVPGIFGAILSSAFGSVLGGPRVLQSLAMDRLAPRFLRKLSKTGQPTIATWVSGLIALIAVGLGGLNAVAQFVTILFLTLYVMINFSATIEKLAGDPSYRPKINIPWYVSLFGSVGAIVVMFLISPLACVIGITFEILLYLILRRRSMKKQWGDVRAGFWGTLARFALIKLRKHGTDPRNWRPHILVFAGNTKKRIHLVHLANWLNQKRGVLTICKLIIGNLKQSELDISKKQQEIDEVLEDEKITAFSEVNIVSSFENGVISTTQANGIAGLRSNTIMFGWSDKKDRLESHLRIMSAVAKIGKSTIIARFNEFDTYILKKRIDIWWGGLQNNGDLMLLLAYLLTLNPVWKNCRIIIHTVISEKEKDPEVQSDLQKLLSDVRIKADTEVIVKSEDKPVSRIIRDYSKNADLVFLGLMIPEPGTESDYIDKMIEISDGLKTTVFVRNGVEFAGELI